MLCPHYFRSNSRHSPTHLLGATDPTGPGPPHYQGFTITLSSTHHTWQDSSGWAISPTQKPLPDNTQPSQQTNIHAPGKMCTSKPNKWAATTHTLDHTATGISNSKQFEKLVQY